jgi:hypothetical protein
MAPTGVDLLLVFVSSRRMVEAGLLLVALVFSFRAAGADLLLAFVFSRRIVVVGCGAITAAA